jgi:type II secretion system protein G
MKRGFTLVELIVVIAIIAILAAVIAPNAFKAIEKAKVSTALADFKTFRTASYAFYSDVGDWPRGWSRDAYFQCDPDVGHLTNVNNWAGWDGPYMEKIKRVDPWAGAYCFEYFDVDASGRQEYFIEFNTKCYPHDGAHTKQCPVPVGSAQLIDAAADDNNLATGAVRRGSLYCGDSGCLAWVIVKDVL